MEEKTVEIFRKILRGENNLYKETIDKYINMVKKDINSRHELVLVKYSKNDIGEMKISNFITNLILLKPFYIFNEPFNKSFLFDCSNINSDNLANHMDKLIIYFTEKEVDFIELNECLASIIEELDDISIQFNILFGNSISLYDEIQLMKKREDYRDLIYYELDPNMSFKEIENDLFEKTQIMTKILSEEDNNFRPYINSKEGINMGQMTQYKINIGPKPDLEGNVYPIVPKSNFLRGLTDVQDYYIDGSGGRKSKMWTFIQKCMSNNLSNCWKLLLAS